MVLVRALFEPLIGEHFFLPPILVTLAFVGWYCGLGPGAVALLVAMVAFDYSIRPRHPVAAHRSSRGRADRAQCDRGGGDGPHGPRHRRAQEGLRRSGERLQLAQQAAKIGTFDWDLATGNVVWTAELEALHGLRAGGFGGTFETWEKLIHPDDRQHTLDQLRAAVESRRDFAFEFRIVQPSGATPVLAGHLGPRGVRPAAAAGAVIGVNLDVTDRKQAEADREAAARRVGLLQNELARLARVQSLGEMASGLAHEINQPLAAILLRAEVSGRKLQQAGAEKAPELRRPWTSSATKPTGRASSSDA